MASSILPSSPSPAASRRCPGAHLVGAGHGGVRDPQLATEPPVGFCSFCSFFLLLQPTFDFSCAGARLHLRGGQAGSAEPSADGWQEGLCHQRGFSWGTGGLEGTWGSAEHLHGPLCPGGGCALLPIHPIQHPAVCWEQPLAAMGLPPRGGHHQGGDHRQQGTTSEEGMTPKEGMFARQVPKM